MSSEDEHVQDAGRLRARATSAMLGMTTNGSLGLASILLRSLSRLSRTRLDTISLAFNLGQEDWHSAEGTRGQETRRWGTEANDSLVAVEAILDVSPDVDTSSHDGW